MWYCGKTFETLMPKSARALSSWLVNNRGDVHGQQPGIIYADVDGQSFYPGTDALATSHLDRIKKL